MGKLLILIVAFVSASSIGAMAFEDFEDPATVCDPNSPEVYASNVNSNDAMVCDKWAPTSCDSHIYAIAHSDGTVFDCVDGNYQNRAITHFRVAAVCAVNIGVGDYYEPYKQHPVIMVPAVDAEDQPLEGEPVRMRKNYVPSVDAVEDQRYCYCQIIGINGGGDFAPSPWWVYGFDYGTAELCSIGCMGFCAQYAQTRDNFRSALFDALE